MKRQKPHYRLFAPAMEISLTRKSSRQNWIYIGMPSNADSPLTVKGKYICPVVFGGALCNGPVYGPNTNLLYTPVVGRRRRFINGSEDRYITGQAYREWINTGDAIKTGLQLNPRHITVAGSTINQPIYHD